MEVTCREHEDHDQKLVTMPQSRKQDHNDGNNMISNDPLKQSGPTEAVAVLNDSINTPISPTTCSISLLDCTEHLPQSEGNGFPTTGFQQFLTLLKKSMYKTLMNETLTGIRLVAHFIIGCLVGFTYYDIGNDAAKVTSNAECLFFCVVFMMFTAMISTILTFSSEMSVYVREHLNCSYSLETYYLAKTLADIPFQIILTTCYVTGIYFITSQPSDAARFGMFLLAAVLIALVSQSFGLLIGAAFNIKVGIFLGVMSTILMVLFSGFFSTINDKPYIQWLQYTSYLKYGFEASMISIYGLNRPKLECKIVYCHFKYPKVFLEEMFLNNDMRSYIIDVAVLGGLFILLKICAYFVLRIKLFQNR